MVYNLTECAALFFAYAAMGWFMEVLYMGVRERHLTNRGFLLGPCCPIYGAGMLGITLLFQGSHYGYWHVFFSIILLCSLLEYAVSALMERVFHTLVGLSRHEVQHSRTDLSGNHAAVRTAGHICPLSHQSVSDDAVSPDSRLCFRKTGDWCSRFVSGRSGHFCLRAAESVPAGR